jgi:glycosyltransferase involved in cell wall biosynthesis
MTLYYISNYNTSVFDSQVIFFVNYLVKHFNFEKICLFIGYSSLEEKKQISTDLLDPNIQVEFFRRFPEYPFFYLLNIWMLKKAFKKNKNDYSNKIVIHVRTEILGYYVLKALPFLNTENLLIDVRGALYPEIKIYYKWFIVRLLKIWLLNNAHRCIRKRNVALSCVSNELKKYLVSTYLHKKDNIIINSCAFSDFFRFDEAQRNSIRKKLQVKENELLIVFSTGGERKWQNSDLIINHLARISSIKILNLSKISHQMKNVFNYFIPITEMPHYLSSADVAIIIREDNLVNRVASPVKFSEYLACGLPVIANNGVTMIEEIINLHKIGKVISSMDEVDEELIQETSRIARDKVKEVAKRYFSIENISKSYYDFYCRNL